MCFWPSPLIFDYGFDVVKSARDVWWQISLVVIAAVSTLFLMWRRSAAGIPALLFFLILAPTSSFVPLISHTIAEHRMYLPLAAVVLLTVLLCEELLLLQTKPHQQQLRLRVGVAAAIILVAVLSSLTYRRSQAYSTALTLWKDTAEQRPQNARARSNYGAELAKAGKLELARPELQAAIQLEPADVTSSPNRVYFAEAHENLGNYFVRSNRPTEAVKAYTEALRISPDRTQDYLLRAQARGRMGDFEGAVVDCSLTIAALPDYADAYQQRAIALTQLKQYDRAWADVRTYERLGGQPHPLLLKQLSAGKPRPSSSNP